MQSIHGIELNNASREELLPGFDAEFPYIATRAELGRYEVPWHWHRAVELFYVESGCVAYATPGGTQMFPAGSGGFLNAGVLHASRTVPEGAEAVQLLHLFEPALFFGGPGSRLEKKFVLPLTASPLELLKLDPAMPEQAALLREIRAAFTLREGDWDHELALCGAMTAIWRKLLALALPLTDGAQRKGESDGQIKAMLIFIREHFHEALTVEQLAAAGHVSRRGCFRLFRETLHLTPLEMIREVRLQEAGRLLAASEVSVTEIAGRCGFGSVSYFGQVFAARYGCTPGEYRRLARSR